MYSLERLWDILRQYSSLKGARSFFADLGYPVMEPLPLDLEGLPEGARKVVASVHELVHVQNDSLFRIFHVELNHTSIRRTDIRRFLDAFYRHQPQGENLFVFSPKDGYDDLAFVSPRRLPDPRDPRKVRLWLRILQVQREKPYRTDLEVLSRIQAHDIRDPQDIWQRHEEAFSVQRVTEQFFQDYSEIFHRIQSRLKETHPGNGPEWARDYTHQLLNRIMFIYFISRKGWLLGPDGKPDRDFMPHFWQAYRETKGKDTFHAQWLPVLFFEAFNGKWQNRAEYLERFPEWLVRSLAQAPFLNGGLYTRRRSLDDLLQHPLPDEVFELLFERWVDGTFPGLFERYNFTVVESGRFDEEVAVDPEMLGMVYERLVNVTFETGDSEDDLRGAAGIFYTPRTEIDLMCRLALVDWLSNHLGKDYKSGSFLVGMMLVLDDLQARCNEALGMNEIPYDRRKRILQDQLYGVDVMEWAVRVAELRLWLQLVVETELDPAELHFPPPLLPNLNLKLRPGDSLLQTVGDLDLSPFRRRELPISPHLKGRITRLRGKKRRFFQGDRSLSEEMLKKEEQDLFRDILFAKIHELEELIKEKKLALKASESFAGMEAPKSPVEEEIGSLNEQLERLKKAHEILKPDQPPPFVWDLAFVEIFEGENPGFDIVIGNPPYVRQEKIRDYLGRFDRKEYLSRLNESLRAIYPGFMGKSRKISGRADYYVYFYLHALSLLADKGTFCFITSNSWLDVDFGKDLQEFFLRHGHLKMVIDNRAKRSFSQADVNTVIVLAGPPERKRPLSEREMRKRLVRFVAFRVPFEEAMNPVTFSEIEDEGLYKPMAGFRVLKKPEFRAVLWDQLSLYREGLESPEGKKLTGTGEYKGDKWGGKYLRAPDIYFTILEKGRGKLVRLGDIAEVRFGIKTGANEFFYLKPVGQTVKEVAELAEKDPRVAVRVKNGLGWDGKIEAKFLRPLLFSLKEAPSVRLNLQHLQRCAFVCRENLQKLRKQGYKHAVSYIQTFAKHKVQLRHGGECFLPEVPSLRGRNPWYALPEQHVPDFISNRFLGERFVFLEGSEVLVCDVFFVGHLKNAEHKTTIVAFLNASLTAMVADILARKTYGIGVAYLYGPEVNNLVVLHPSFLSLTQRKRLLSAFDQLAEREARSIFEELGFELCRKRRCRHPEHPYEYVKPEALTLEQVRQASPDRYELDSVVFDVLGLTEEERLEVYRAVAQLVKDRLVKARSV